MEPTQELEGSYERTLHQILSGSMHRPTQFKSPALGFRPLEEYDVGVVHVRIGLKKGEGVYFVDEPVLTPSEEASYASALDTVYFTFPAEELTSEQVGDVLRAQVNHAADGLGLELPPESVDKVIYYIRREIFGYGPIDAVMLDPAIEDIACDGAGVPITIKHRRYGNLGWLLTNVLFLDEASLSDFIRRQAHRVGRGVSVAQPYGDFILPDGSRMACNLGREVTADGSSFTIRKFPAQPYTLPALIRDGMLSSLMAAYLWYVIEQKRIIFLAGPTASGKTTLSSALLNMLDPKLRYVTIEDTPEIKLPGFRKVPHVTRRSYTMTTDPQYEVKLVDLMAHSMRERPDYLIVGEVRTAEQLLAFTRTATTGHGGVTTIHANDPQTLLIRLRAMNADPSALDLLWGAVVTNCWGRGVRQLRRVTSISEILPPEDTRGEGKIETIFAWKEPVDRFHPEEVDELQRLSSRLRLLARSRGEPDSAVGQAIEEKHAFLNHLVENCTFGFKAVSQAAKQYYTRRILVEAGWTR